MNTENQESTPIWQSPLPSSAHDSQEERAEDLEQEKEKVTPFKKRKATRRSSPIVESQVRRSVRVMKNNKGFKGSSCSDRKCTACNPKPPILSKEVILNLGVQLCDLKEDQLAEEALMTISSKKKKAGLIARKEIQAQVDTTIDGDVSAASKAG